ncbi:hypothetical protein PC116_g8079 [Phytophthora cactorum]|uniref:Uncharacterized protein n=1 Tax=Phytophthora cactorum TaxID=29920 RepID=A0A8T1E721_9STRA|nr:hypothetical protein PC117_g5403 [Phytophthora cactorum]KAG3033587.1 hypothetical protein PC119_g5288 [Phytophthora cactorum]KAG4060428.1 hypothetical protein PC123_g4679 [Phytophthora cactorum]KAG4244119.1 hypothetical protein PC116_g8079 [Phytophthora cactorum]
MTGRQRRVLARREDVGYTPPTSSLLVAPRMVAMPTVMKMKERQWGVGVVLFLRE